MTYPNLSVIIPAYNSGATIAGCLDALRQQTYTDFEVIVVDSGTSDESQTIVAAHYPEVRFFRSPVQLPPQAARDEGARHAHGNVYVFTDPDIYPAVDWLAKMVDAHARFGSVIAGAIDCYGHKWLDVGIHLCKFHKVLPGVHSSDISASGNMMCSRELFEIMKGFNTYEVQGDVTLSWRMTDEGHPIHFVSGAVVYHDHQMSWGAYTRERWRRGFDYAALRAKREGWNTPQVLRMLLITVFPVRLASLMLKVGISSARAGRLGDYVWTLPIILWGQAVWLGGEARYLLSRLLKK